jgi:hypothetical protein
VSKRLKIYIGVFIGVIALMMYLEYTKPKPLDWHPTFSAHDKIPFGAYVLADELPKLFPKKNLQFIENQTPAYYLNTQDSIGTDNVYLIVDGYARLTEADANALLAFVDEGNDVFFLSHNLQKTLADSLYCKTGTHRFVLENEYKKVQISLSNPAFGKKKYGFKKMMNLESFEKIDTANVTILGIFERNNLEEVNFIKQKYGRGNFYIHLLPEAFSNYYLLNDSTYTYAVGSLNYINKKNIFWHEYKKSVDTPNESLLSHIFRNPPLHWAWLILIFGAIIYCVFFGKRLQRIIPIITPLRNSTVEFTKTIGNLYYNSREHNDLIQKKIKYFLFFVKEKYYIDTEKIDSDFSEKLHLKSGVSKETTNKIVHLINKNRRLQTAIESDLVELNEIIDEFYRKTKN